MMFRQINLPIQISILLFLFSGTYGSYASEPFSGGNNKPGKITEGIVSAESRMIFHEDSLHRLDLSYPDKKRGLKPWIAPAALITSGTAFHFMPSLRGEVRDFMQKNVPYHGSIEDYLLFAPGAAVYALNFAGIPGKNNFGNRSALLVKSILLNSFITFRMKVWINAPRPNQEKRSFPSGHTSSAFTFAHFMHKEYGEQNVWYSISAYSVATAVGVFRMAKNVHWLSDVLAGAGIGIFSTELVYLTHQYKWDNEHLRRLDIFPWKQGNQKGLTLVYQF